MKRNYFYLVAGLQDIALDTQKLKVNITALKEELKMQLHQSDFRLSMMLFLPYDNANLLNIIQKKDKVFDSRGNFPQSYIEENIKIPGDDLPEYFIHFIEAYNANEDIIPGMSSENQLTSLFYNFMEAQPNKFLKNWFSFYQTLNNLTTALLSRKYNLPYEDQIIGNGLIPDAIRKSNARDFGLSAELDFLEDLLNIVKIDNVQEREKAVDQIKWQYLDEVTFFEYFTIEKIMAYIIKLGIVERWLSIDKSHGEILFKELLDNMKSSYELPKQFTDKK